jgi:hypothetical protein
MELLKGKGSATQVVYLKYIMYEDKPVDERFLLAANTTSNATTTADATEVDNNNNTSNEIPTSTNNTAADTSEEQIGNTTSNTPVEGQGNENLAPVAMLPVDRTVAHPGDRVFLMVA